MILAQERKSEERKVTIYATGFVEDGKVLWLFQVHEHNQLIAGNFGEFTNSYNFGKEQANLYALAQAYRWQKENADRFRVILLCCADRSPRAFRGRRAA